MRLRLSVLTLAALLALPFVACQRNDDNADNNESAAAAAQIAFRACKDKLAFQAYAYTMNECDQVKPINGAQSFGEWMISRYGNNYQYNNIGSVNPYAANPNVGNPYVGNAYPNNPYGANPYYGSSTNQQTSYDSVLYFRYLRGVCNSDDFRQLEMDYQFLASRNL